MSDLVRALPPGRADPLAPEHRALATADAVVALGHAIDGIADMGVLLEVGDDLSFRVLAANDTARRVLETAGNRLEDSPFEDRFDPPRAQELPRAYLRALAGGEAARWRDDLELAGPAPHLEISLVPLRVDGTDLALWIGRDIGAQRADALGELRRLIEDEEPASGVDALTGIFDRRELLERLDRAIVTVSRRVGGAALLVLNIDRFRQINDTLGHQIGDEVLQVVASRLRRSLRAGDTIARLGADEFGIILTGIGQPSDAEQIARKLLGVVAEPLVIDDLVLTVAASVGIAISPGHGTEAAELLQSADLAMFRAKQRRLGVTAYDADHDRGDPRSLQLLSQLGGAIDRGELVLHYQPTFSLASRQLVGVEALVRWQHPEAGLIEPARFVPLAERSALIKPLSEWVLGTALAQAARWRQMGWDPQIAVNLSAKNLPDPELHEVVTDALASTGLPADRLVLEITESAIVSDPTSTRAAIQRLAAEGVAWAIDDFGAGYSSLSLLKELPVAQIKIDRSFVTSMESNPADDAIVRTIIELGHRLGLCVMAEGVESGTLVPILRRAGCDLAQGFALGRPVPADVMFRDGSGR